MANIDIETKDSSIITPTHRKAGFNLFEILYPDTGGIPTGRVARWEAAGRRNNPHGTKLPLTIDKVDRMMRRNKVLS